MPHGADFPFAGALFGARGSAAALRRFGPGQTSCDEFVVGAAGGPADDGRGGDPRFGTFEGRSTHCVF